MTFNSNNNNNEFKNFPTIETDSYAYDQGLLNNSFCENCTVIFYTDIPFNVYKIKDHSNLFLCEKCYFQIQLEHAKRGIKWEGTKSWYGVRECSDLQ
jgi:hypothetical protein